MTFFHDREVGCGLVAEKLDLAGLGEFVAKEEVR